LLATCWQLAGNLLATAKIFTDFLDIAKSLIFKEFYTFGVYSWR
jgi:hypothetical protein